MMTSNDEAELESLVVEKDLLENNEHACYGLTKTTFEDESIECLGCKNKFWPFQKASLSV